jgi:hypothetical protein
MITFLFVNEFCVFTSSNLGSACLHAAQSGIAIAGLSGFVMAGLSGDVTAGQSGGRKPACPVPIFYGDLHDFFYMF